MSDRIVVPRLLTRSWTTWLSVAAAVVGAYAVVGWYAVTDAPNRPWALLLGILVTLAIVPVLLRRRWIEPETGVLVLEVMRIWRRSWRLAAPSAVRIEPNGAGQVHLVLRDPERRSPMRVALVANDLGGPRALDPVVVSAVADQLDHWGTSDRVVARLRAQVDHLDAGGSVAGSPLAGPAPRRG